ncbi:MAG: hypothetical protein QNJ81_13925 [Acidimicrobiia bacterium]|nr:hypothetical protein [Acidimicrobiia bacterium]
MAFEIGVAYGYLDLMDAMKQFAAGWPKEGSITFTGTGNADLKYVRAKGAVATTPLETWTVVCTTAGGIGVAQFSVTGSISGPQAAATAGTLYDNGIIRFLITGPASYAAVLSDQWQFTFAQGTLDASNEKWTIERDVTATLLNPTDNQELILRGPGAPSGTDEIFVGIKNYFDVGADVYNWQLQGFTAYSAGSNFHEQPGAIPKSGFAGTLPTSEANCPMTTYVRDPNEIKYWFVVNGRRIIVSSAFEAHFNTAYLGWLLPYYTPAQWNYPLFIGGNVGTEGNLGDSIRYSDLLQKNQQFWNWMLISFNVPDEDDLYAAGRLLGPGGTWLGFCHGNGNRTTTNPIANAYFFDEGANRAGFWPYMKKGMLFILDNIDGSFATFPIIAMGKSLATDLPAQWYGVLDGINAISGFNQAQENTFVDGGDTWVVIRSTNDSEFEDYAALRLA